MLASYSEILVCKSTLFLRLSRKQRPKTQKRRPLENEDLENEDPLKNEDLENKDPLENEDLENEDP